MIYVICMAVAFLACVIGKICGMGGGVIIKPVLDALGVASTAAINFMSGCTVIGMSCWSVGKSVISKDSQIDWKLSTWLAIGAAIGGITGKQLYSSVAALFEDPNMAGAVQAGCLLLATLATMIYTIKKETIPSRHVTNPAACLVIGLGLGLLGAFLGIGGGPFNMAVLFFFFSMPTKVAAQNSLYIILISQTTGILKTVLSGKIPELIPVLLIAMVLCGILGSEIGGRLNKHMDNKRTTKLFEGAMILVMLISCYNMVKYLV